MGIISGLIAYFFYFECSDIKESETINQLYNCAIKGPENLINYFIDTGGLIFQIILIWISYILIHYSDCKGIPNFRYLNINNNSNNKYKGGRLNIFMMLEFINNVIVLLISLYLYYHVDINNIKNINSCIYFVKVIYGLFSFPFIIFIFSPFIVLLTKTRETMYNKNAQCLPFLPDIYKKELKKQDILKEKEKKKQLKKRKIIEENNITLTNYDNN